VSQIVLTLRQPAQFGSKARRDNVLSTMEHIPGSVVRGALAVAWLARNGISRPGTPGREEFLNLFEGPVRYGALLRDGTEFMSLAVVGHKYAPTDACAIVDYDRAAGEEPPPFCPDCGSPLDQQRGLTGERDAPRRRTSVAITPDGTAGEGALFTRETIAAEQVFRGTVTTPDDRLLKILDGLGPVRVGGRRTTHGLADVTITRDASPPLPQRRPDGTLIVRLRSPAIFTDDHGRPSREPSAHELQDALGVPARVTRGWTRWEESGGWHVASGLPKPQELTVAAGSTYLISAERALPDSALARLSARGLGLRRHEGYGDLAPPPVLRPGRAEREREARRKLEL
jgi:CRISPR-associated protein Csx10